MLSQQRYTKILQRLNEKKTITVSELSRELNISESTIRRDLTSLDKEGKLKKIHGGATAIGGAYLVQDDEVRLRSNRFPEEKRQIGLMAASQIDNKDFIYIDAGTSTEAMIEFIEAAQAVFVTNGMDIAAKLIKKGLRVIIIGGEIKPLTNAVVGIEAVNGLKKYHFSKGFFGTNGIDYEAGFSTPDPNEAQVKKEALLRCKKSFILADPSKFNVTTPVTFAELSEATIITTKLSFEGYEKATKILEVEKGDLHSDF
ncbi:DeoR/GlpR family DNA-binding transcription regulator [Eubacteriaceae bacterium ES3]|nr:DeoR/GlpR family DNA-binding transcription regulator [Eubacteriaceae bacterium ES3]